MLLFYRLLMFYCCTERVVYNSVYVLRNLVVIKVLKCGTES